MIKGPIIIFIITGLIVLGLALAFRQKTNYNLAPRKIWTYWDNPDRIPKTVKICIESW
jgi:hypothetical protein